MKHGQDPEDVLLAEPLEARLVEVLAGLERDPDHHLVEVEGLRPVGLDHLAVLTPALPALREHLWSV